MDKIWQSDWRSYTVVFFVSLLILMIGISADPSWKLDEVCYVGAARSFNAGTPSVNPEHPPLVKYLIALSIKTFGDSPLGWRFPSGLAGAIVALSGFGLSLRLTRTLRSAYAAWLLLMANGFLFVMSRMANLSIFELAFEMAGVWLFVVAIEKNAPFLFACSGALFGLSVASRWCGAVGLTVCGAYALVKNKRAVVDVLLMGSTAVATYAVTWIPLMVREHRSGTYLITANRFILHFHQFAVTDSRPGEPWFTWPTMFGQQESLTEMVANPVVAAFGLVALVVLLWNRKPLLPALYVAHIMQWAIVSSHWQHYYYYLEAFTWLTMALASAMQGVTIRRLKLDVIVLACALASASYPVWGALR